MTKIKLCGLSRDEEIAAANDLLPEYAGFVFFEESRRYVSPEAAKRLRTILDQRIDTVGVFVDARPEQIRAICGEGTIRLIQLHGNESRAYIQRLQEDMELPVIKAFGVTTPDDIREANESPADLVLLDYKRYGSGRSFDWGLLRDMKRPYFLAGGLDAAKAAKAVRTLSPYAVDVSSGIETNGKKDGQKMASFVRCVREADAGLQRLSGGTGK